MGLFAVLSSFVPLSLLIILGVLDHSTAPELLDVLKVINNMNISYHCPALVCKDYKQCIKQVRCEDLQGLVGVVGRICRSFVIS